MDVGPCPTPDRHHADTAHAYQRLVAGGVPKSNIVAMQFNDVPGDPENPYPNTLFNVRLPPPAPYVPSLSLPPTALRTQSLSPPTPLL